MKVYLAAPIFTEAAQMYNDYVVNKILEKIPDLDIYVPQRNKDINDKTKCATAEDITVGDFDNNLNHTDVVIALVDNDTPPIGTVTEIGYFARICQEEIERQGYTNKKIISLYTDTRECSHTVIPEKIEMLNQFAESQFSYLNLLLVGVLKRYGKMCRTVDEVVEEVKKSYEEYKSILPNENIKCHSCRSYLYCCAVATTEGKVKCINFGEIEKEINEGEN